ncbi:acetate--CoA ligase family protein [Chachezhania sediminis]|uniref:acetate--CoA ligase family protein n=1 Tax=Chachezhania sediminis TaxID=2599291 RepID=UPI00131CE2BA|nr:acetate--CoA ligase family protein [Chachezhania sediminis]
MNHMTRPARIAEMLEPRSVAVIGASEDLTKFGGRLFKLLVQHGYGGQIFPINRKQDSILGLKCHASIGDTPVPPDMAVMAVPRDHVKAAVRECAEAGTKAAIIITAKFSDAGSEGAALEAEIVEEARKHGMRLIGPNCLGIISPANRLVLCASPALFVDQLLVGRIGMVSQSGALMATIFDRAQTRGVGFSHCFSIGNQADLNLCDFLDFLVEDRATDVICTYIEGVTDGPRFLDVATRARAAGKPILAVKAGRTADGAAAAFSHTASLAGGYEAFAAACAETGVVVMDDPDAMIMLAAALTKFETPSKAATSILTTSGGGGAITADRLSDFDLPLTTYAPETVKALEEYYFPANACANPIDMGAAIKGGSMLVGEGSAQALLSDPETGIVLAPITTAPDMRLLCECLASGMRGAEEAGHRKPFLVVVQPGRAGDKARAELLKNGLFYFDSIDEALRVIDGYRTLTERTPPTPDKGSSPGTVPAGLSGALDEATAKALLAEYGVPVNAGVVVADAVEAEEAAQGLAGPFVVKVVSPDIVHKSDAGGVVLNLPDGGAVGDAVAEMTDRLAARHPKARIEGFLVQEMVRGELEMFVGARRDPIFGPVVMVGAGGVLVELMQDVSVRLAPVSVAEAKEMILGLKVAPLLTGFRGSAPLDVDALADAVARIGWLACDLGADFAELDVNPVLVRKAGQGVTGVDARLLLEEEH